MEEGALKNPGSGLAIHVHIEDPTNNPIWEGDVQTNKHGAFMGTFTLPEDGKTGAYQIIGDVDGGNTIYGSFEVDQYRKPEYLVEVHPLTPRVVSGDKLRAQVKASYFFGAPVANASVKYSI